MSILKDKHELIGTSFNHDGYDQAVKERWEKINDRQYHCKIHGTYFDPVGSDEIEGADAEPCWSCYNEFKIRL